MKTGTKENLIVGTGLGAAFLAAATLPALIDRVVNTPIEGDSFRIEGMEDRTVYTEQLLGKFGLHRSNPREVIELNLEGCRRHVVIAKDTLSTELEVGKCLRLDEIEFPSSYRPYYEVKAATKTSHPERVPRPVDDSLWLVPFMFS